MSQAFRRTLSCVGMSLCYPLAVLLLLLLSISPAMARVQDVTLPGDPIFATSANSPSGEGVANAIDNTNSTKYVNLDKLNAGFIVTPSVGRTIVTSLAITTGDDAPERDPMTFQLSGSNDAVATINGNWTPITDSFTPTGLATDPGRSMTGTPVNFTNPGSFKSYRLIFETVRNATLANSMQVAEVYLYGTQDAAQAGPAFQVNSIGDHNNGACTLSDCTLREAITAANSNPGDDTINFASNVTGTITLQSTLPTITSNITLAGPGDDTLAVSRGEEAPEFRILSITGARTVSISGLTISNGHNSQNDGGGIYNEGSLTLNGCTLANNRASRPGGNGGGLYSRGTVNITGCLFSGNSANSGGGGFYSNFAGPATVLNSNFAGNTASHGGGLYNAGGSLAVTGCTVSGSTTGGGVTSSGGSNATLNLTNCTVSGNSHSFGGGVAVVVGRATIMSCTLSSNTATYYGGGLYMQTEVLIFLKNSIVAGNTAGVGTNIYTTGGLTDGGGNLTTNDPRLGPLQDNGGPTPTHLPLSDSPAIDAGLNGGAPATDQRGLARPTDGDSNGTATVDSGAVEMPAGYSPRYSVSGRIADAQGAGISGVHVSRGNGVATAVTNSAGYYNMTGVPNGTYTLTPGLSNYTFTPATRSITVNGANLGSQNFTGKTGVSLSGRISNSAGVAIAGVTVARSGSPRTAVTNSAGYYTFIGVQPGNVTITPSKAGTRFAPGSKTLTVGTTDISNQNFIGYTGYSIIGRITNSSGVAVGGISVRRSGSNTSVTTNSAGYYTFNDVPNGTYTLTPSATNSSFTPATRNITVNSADISGQNFVVAPAYSIAGRITRSSDGAALSGVVVTLSSSGATATTNSAGYFTFTSVPNGTYTLTPSLNGYTFAPPTRSATVNGANVGNQNFIGSGA